MLAYTAQILILGMQVAHLAVVGAVVRHFKHADVRQFAEAAAEEAPLGGLSRFHVGSWREGWHLHRRCTGLALRRCLVGDAAGGKRLAEVERLTVFCAARGFNVQQS